MPVPKVSYDQFFKHLDSVTAMPAAWQDLADLCLILTLQPLY
jgi:hypothetical protein